MAFLKRIQLSGFKSIKHMDLELRPLNVLIGANGAGKSNLISCFRLFEDSRLLEVASQQEFRVLVAKSGGADAILFYGAKTTSSITIDLEIAPEANDSGRHHHVTLAYAPDDSLTVASQSDWAIDQEGKPLVGSEMDRGGPSDVSRRELYLFPLLPDIHTFQFHDTSGTAAIRRSTYIHDNRRLRHDAGNLAAILYRLQQKAPACYGCIVETIRQVAPWFGHFVLKPLELNENNVRLDWREQGSDKLFGPHQLPDGALRAMALITLLLQPKEDLPDLLIIDEPELGLHPFAINAVAGLLKAASIHRQILVATQSVSFLDQFEPEDVVVVQREQVPGERQKWESEFDRLQPGELADWLAEYSLSELWEKNVLGGGPV